MRDDERETFLAEMREHADESRRTQYAWMVQWAEEMQGHALRIDHAVTVDDMIQNVHVPLGRVYYLAARLVQCFPIPGNAAQDRDVARYRTEYYTMANVLCGTLQDVHQIHGFGLVYGTPEWNTYRDSVRQRVMRVAQRMADLVASWAAEYPDVLPSG